jgi:general secretion pathway protein A
MFLKFYGLREQPFGTTPNPRFLYPSAVHREALATLIYGIESNLGFAALIAEPGMGKTTLLFHLLARFKNTARTAFLFETQCDAQSLLRYLLAELGVPMSHADPVVLREKFKQILYQEARLGRRVIVIIDEAQNLDAKVLESLRLLSNFETAEAKLLHIILVGQPRLGKQLGHASMSQLLQRIAMISFLRPLQTREVIEYMDHRLRVAGYSGPQLFTTSALERIAELSNGVPRNINAICFNAMSLGCVLAASQIDRQLIDEVGVDLDLTLLLRKAQQGCSLAMPGAANRAANTETARPEQVSNFTVLEDEPTDRRGIGVGVADTSVPGMNAADHMTNTTLLFP